MELDYYHQTVNVQVFPGVAKRLNPNLGELFRSSFFI